MQSLRLIFASAYSALITVAVVTAMTIGAELSPAFKNWLAGFTGHHWVTKSWISVIVFVVFLALISALRKNVSKSQLQNALSNLQTSVITGSVVIVSFYLYEFFV